MRLRVGFSATSPAELVHSLVRVVVDDDLAAVSLAVRKFLSLIASSFGVACMRESNYATPNLLPCKM